MTQKNILLIFTGGLLAGGCLLFWNQLQDATLLPRIVFVAVWLLLFSPVVLKLFTENKWTIDLVDILFGLFVLLHFISILEAINKPEALYESQKMFLIFSAYMVFKKALFKKHIEEGFLLKVVASICVAYLFYGLLQLLSLVEYSKPEGDSLYAVSSLAGHKNLYSGFLLMSSFLLLSGIRTAKGYWKVLYIVLPVLQLILILVLQTRSVFLALVASIFTIAIGLFFLQGKKAFFLMKKFAVPFMLIIVGVAGFAFFTGTGQEILHRFNVSNFLKSDTGIERYTVWYKSYFLLKDYWLTGVGAHNWMLVYPKYSLSGMFRTQYLNMVFLEPHNDLLWVWCELGIVGLLVFVSVFTVIIYCAFKKMSLAKTETSQQFYLLLGTMQIAFIVFCFFDFPKERIDQQLILTLSWAMISAQSQDFLQSWNVPIQAIKPILLSTLLLVLSSAIAIGGRMKADSYMRDMLAAQARGDSKSVLELAKLMRSPFAQLSPQAVPKVWYEGVAAYQLDQKDLAYECFLKAKEQSPFNHNVLNNLGGMETYFKKYDHALATYKEAIRINPKNDDTRFNIAYTLYWLHRYDEALDTLKLVWSNPGRKAEFEKIIISGRDSKINDR
ncbi:MAG: O-antigen ligase family protein [Chitinophagales bacterium]